MRQHGAPLSPLAAIDDLRDLATAPGPFLTVHMRLHPPAEDLAERVALAWRSSREQAAAAGAPESALAAVDDAMASDPHRRGPGISVISTPSGHRHVEHLAVVPEVDLVRWEPTPSLTPLLAARQRSPAHVVVLVDREGADVLVRSSTRVPGGEGDIEVHGDDFPLTKVAAGGWSQRRYQQRAEETWRRNMSEVADELTSVVRRVDPAVVALGGDERATGLLHDRLPPEVRERIHPIAPTRAADGSARDLDSEVERVVRTHVEGELAKTADVYGRELGQRDRATAGPADTLAALRAARVAVLLVPVGVGDERRAWIDADRQVAVSPDSLPDGERAQSAPLIDAVVTAALATNADVRIVPEEAAPAGGVGALLRW